MQVKAVLLILMTLASVAMADDGNVQGGFNTELIRLHIKVSEAQAALIADLTSLNTGKWGMANVPDKDQLAKIHQDEKLLDDALKEWEDANQSGQ